MNDDSKDDQIKELEEQLEDARKVATECRQIVSQHQRHLTQLKDEVDNLKKDKKLLVDQVDSQHGVIESQKKKLVTAESQSLQNRRRHRNETDEQYRLELENQK